MLVVFFVFLSRSPVLLYLFDRCSLLVRNANKFLLKQVHVVSDSSLVCLFHRGSCMQCCAILAKVIHYKRNCGWMSLPLRPFLPSRDRMYTLWTLPLSTWFFSLSHQLSLTRLFLIVTISIVLSFPWDHVCALTALKVQLISPSLSVSVPLNFSSHSENGEAKDLVAFQKSKSSLDNCVCRYMSISVRSLSRRSFKAHHCEGSIGCAWCFSPKSWQLVSQGTFRGNGFLYQDSVCLFSWEFYVSLDWIFVRCKLF